MNIKANQTSLSQALNIVAAVGTTNAIILQGQPGVGKTQGVEQFVRENLPDYAFAYVCCPDLSLGDIAMPVVNKDTLQTEWALSARFNLKKGQEQPVFLLLDEFDKCASKDVQNMLSPCLHERRLGTFPLPAGSIVVATANLLTDGVTKTPLQGHVLNRSTVLDVANPTSDEWIDWAMSNNVAPEVVMFVKEHPQCLERYDNLTDEDNPYVYHPLKGRMAACVTPRSLQKASNIVKQRKLLGDALLPALAGTIGEAAARDMEALIALSTDMPRIADVLANPDKCDLPKSSGAYMMTAFSLVSTVAPDTVDAIVTYITRWTDAFEAQALFVLTGIRAKGKASTLMSCKGFLPLAAKYSKLV